MKIRAALSFAALAALVAACGGVAEKSPRDPSAQNGAPSTAYASESPAAPPPPAPQAGPPDPGSPKALARSARIKDFYARGVELDQAGPDCRAACRALGAMDRAAGELCDVDGRDGICKDAETRVRDARDRVRGTCGTCPDGVVLDRSAPVPSR